MHAIRLHEFGPAGNLTYEEVPDPEPGPGQLRIAVAASGVHLIDTTIRSGAQAGAFPLPELPAIPGREVAGVVDALGPGADPAWLGRRVVAHLGMASAGYAELAVREADAVHPIPDGLADDAAVAMIGTGRTAVGILDDAKLTTDDVVLITAAAGGIGSLLVQAAKHAGATVAGVAGGEAKTALVRRLGADVAVDYTAPEWGKAVREALGERAITVVLDGVGGELGRGAFDLAGMGGRVLVFGWSSGSPLEFGVFDLYREGLTVGVAIGPRLLRVPGALRALETRSLAMAAEGWLTPVVDRFPLAEAARAHTALESRATTGKVVLIP